MSVDDLMRLPAGNGPKVTTPGERDAILPGTVVRDAQGTIACRHPSGLGVVFGDDRPFAWEYLALPAEIIWPSTPVSELFDAANDLVWLSEWIDAGNADRDPEAVTWGRLAKITEEAGEVIAAFIGMTGQNPRKGVTHTEQDVYDELLDVAVTALGAAEHLAGHQGAVLDGLLVKIHLVAERARAVHS